jgi:galacturonosyltransferase
MKAKGIDEYLDAAKVIKNKYPHFHFHVIGSLEEDYESKLNEFEKKGIIKYHGPVDNVQPYYEMCHAIINPTQYPEGMSNVLLEAAATGRPLISSDIVGSKEALLDGVSGFLILQDDNNDILNKILSFISLSKDDKIKMGFESRKWIEKNFNRNSVVNKYLETINKHF